MNVAQWSEGFGCAGILVYTDNGLVDPWLVAQIILENTAGIAPLIAVQPVYMHPYTVAKMVTSLAFLHGRRIYLNMLAGGFRNDLLSLNDPTPHDDRYQRMTEYTKIIKLLLESDTAVTFDGKYYQIRNLKLSPSLPPELHPGILVSGSSPSGMSAAMELNATAVKYPRPPGVETGIARDEASNCGVRVGIIARDSDQQAWHIARERFPEDRKGQITHELAMKVSDSHWHQQLSSDADDKNGDCSQVYWLGPFHNYKTFCPYLVGSYDRVAREVASYGELGYRTIILDIPPDEEELRHIGTVFNAAEALLKE